MGFETLEWKFCELEPTKTDRSNRPRAAVYTLSLEFRCWEILRVGFSELDIARPSSGNSANWILRIVPCMILVAREVEEVYYYYYYDYNHYYYYYYYCYYCYTIIITITITITINYYYYYVIALLLNQVEEVTAVAESMSFHDGKYYIDTPEANIDGFCR